MALDDSTSPQSAAPALVRVANPRRTTLASVRSHEERRELAARAAEEQRSR